MPGDPTGASDPSAGVRPLFSERSSAFSMSSSFLLGFSGIKASLPAAYRIGAQSHNTGSRPIQSCTFKADKG